MTPRKPKYGNKRCEMDGYKFDSMKERDYYAGYLKPLEMAGKISNIVVHPKYSVIVEGEHICTVILDFRFYDKEQIRDRHIDVKGFYTPISRLKHKLLSANHNIQIEIVK